MKIMSDYRIESTDQIDFDVEKDGILITSTDSVGEENRIFIQYDQFGAFQQCFDSAINDWPKKTAKDKD